MSKVGKKHKNIQGKLADTEIKNAVEAFDFIIKNKYANFDETLDADVVLGIDPAKGEQTVRGSVLLPHGTGKQVRILVFAKGDPKKAAEKCGNVEIRKIDESLDL